MTCPAPLCTPSRHPTTAGERRETEDRIAQLAKAERERTAPRAAETRILVPNWPVKVKKERE